MSNLSDLFTTSKFSINRLNYIDANSPISLNISKCDGTYILTNTGTTNSIIVNLPAGFDGARVNAIITSNYDFSFVASNNETIRFLDMISISNGSIKSSTVGEQLQLDWTGSEWIASVLGTNWQLETS